jgi:Zn-dependent M28 family amino/carboxypeptidase
VNGLSDEELARIALYLNFDMVGSPNYIFMTQDADQSSFVAPVVVPDGSVAIEDLSSPSTRCRTSRTTTPRSTGAATTRRSS